VRFQKLLVSVKLTRMCGADLVTEPPRELQNNHKSKDVHELGHHEHHIADGDGMAEKKR